MALAATRDRDEALDIVQDAMTRCALRYGTRPPDEWPPLFFRILERRILDWHRRARVRGIMRRLLGSGDDDATGDDAVMDGALPADTVTPERGAADAQLRERLGVALSRLPLRQQQVFLLREVQGFDVRQTAEIMQCSNGSVKTHHARARAALRERLEDLYE